MFENFLKDERNWNFTPVFIHGDFDSSQILYQPSKGVCGVIDFEDAGMGDPAYDFCCFLAEYGSDFLQGVLYVYKGIVDENLLERISFHAKRILFCELLYGIEYNQSEFVEHGLERLRRAMDNCYIIGSSWIRSTSLTSILEGIPE